MSEAPSTSAPVEYELRADLNESKSVRLYAMADSGYSVADTEVTPTGANSAKWMLAPDSSGTAGAYGAAGAKIALGTVTNGAGKVYFWAKALSTSDETPVSDVSVTLVATGVAHAV